MILIKKYYNYYVSFNLIAAVLVYKCCVPTSQVYIQIISRVVRNNALPRLKLLVLTFYQHVHTASIFPNKYFGTVYVQANISFL